MVHYWAGICALHHHATFIITAYASRSALVELDPVAEEIYQRLMHCHLEQDEPARVLETYRRCRQMLSVGLGISSGPQAEKLAVRARRQ